MLTPTLTIPVLAYMTSIKAYKALSTGDQMSVEALQTQLQNEAGERSVKKQREKGGRCSEKERSDWWSNLTVNQQQNRTARK